MTPQYKIGTRSYLHCKKLKRGSRAQVTRQLRRKGMHAIQSISHTTGQVEGKEPISPEQLDSSSSKPVFYTILNIAYQVLCSPKIAVT